MKLFDLLPVIVIICGGVLMLMALIGGALGLNSYGGNLVLAFYGLAFMVIGVIMSALTIHHDRHDRRK